MTARKKAVPSFMLPGNPSPRSLPSGIITAMFTDIVDSTRIKSLVEGETSARRDTHFRQNIKEPHDAVVLACVQLGGGHIVNPTGDGYCITFIDAEEAVLCGLRIQHHLQAHPIETPLGALQIRIGLHTGIAGPSGDDYIASTIDKTARVQGKAGGGQVFVSHQTQVLVSDRIRGVQFVARGIFDLKGLQSEELYEAIPLPDLKLSLVDTGPTTLRKSENAGELDSPYPSITKAKITRRKPVVALLGLGAVVAAGLLFFAKSHPETLPLSKPVLPVDSQWDGSFHFLPPMAEYDGSVGLHITERKGEDFSGIYSTENNTYQWIIEGKVIGNTAHWDYIKSVKSPGKEDAVGKAHGDVSIENGRMTGFFRMATDSKEVAQLDLREAQ